MPPSVNDLIAAYERHGSLTAAGREVGMTKQTLHKRLVKSGYVLPNVRYTEAEREAIFAFYRDTPEEHFDLEAFAASIGRPKTNVARFAKLHGLTRQGRKHRPEVAAAIGKKQAANIAANGHPRGFLGNKHTDEARATISKKSKLMQVTHETFGLGNYSPESRQRNSDRVTALAALRPVSNAYSRCRDGYREDIGIYVRSAWEANYARYLNWLKSLGEIEHWEYEPKTFWFLTIKRGVRSYKPDFRVREKGKDYYVEVKGWMDAKSKTKIKRMKVHYPEIDLRVVGEKQYRAIANKVSRIVKGWE